MPQSQQAVSPLPVWEEGPEAQGSEAFQAVTTAREEPALLREFFRQMMTIRVVEERLLTLFSEGLLNGTVHTCLGQEACAVGVVSALDPEKDILFSNHRGHGHFLAYCDEVEGLIAELMGRRTGVCGGLGGSQHLHKRNFYSNGIQGGIAPVATGMAFAEKAKQTGAIAAVFLGDGTFGEGVVYESFNLAALWGLPILFVVEQNGYAQSTPTAREHAGDLETRGGSFGIRAIAADGNEVAAVSIAAREATDYIRRESKPCLLFLRTYRLGPHSKGDDTRDPAEIARHRQEEPIARLQAQLDADWREQVTSEIRERVERAVEAARQSPVTDFFEAAAAWLE